jgi:NitT/TauT family transport system substrate-binding protein
MKRIGLAGTALLLVVLLVAPAAQTQPLTKIRQAGFKVIDLAVPLLAKAKGIFQKNGLDFEYVEIDSGKLGVASLLSGNVQFVDLGVDDIVDLQKEGKDPILIYSMVNSLTMDLVVRNDVLRRLNVTPASPLESKIKALRGLTFGITRPGAVTQLFPQYLLRKAGYNPERDATFVQVGGGQALVAAIRSKRIEAFMLSAPAPYILEKSGDGTVLIKNSAGQGPKEFADFAFESITVMKSWANANAATVEAYTRSLNQAYDWMLTDRPTALRLLKVYFPETDDATLALSFNALVPALKKGGRLSQQAITNQADVLSSIGALNGKADTREGVLWTNQFIK